MSAKNEKVYYDDLSKEAMDKNAKVYVKFNPYTKNDFQAEISTIEQVLVYHKKLRGSRILGELLKDKQVPTRKRKRIVKDLLKYWDRQFKEETDLQKKALIDRTLKIKHRRIKHISFVFPYLFGFITIIALILSQRISYLTKIPFISTLIIKIYDFLDFQLYYNLLILLIYLSFVSCLYLIILKSYFEIMRKTGHNAEKFIKDEFNKLRKRYMKQHKIIKNHLFKYMYSKRYKRKYHLEKIYDPNLVIKELDSYGNYIEEKTDSFKKKYFRLRFISFLLKISTIGLTIYLIINYQNLN